MLKNKLAIIGDGGHGQVVADCAKLMQQWQNIEFFDDSFKLDKTVDALISKGDKNIDIFIAIGNNKTRELIYQKLKKVDFNFPILRHPSAIICDDVLIKEASILLAGSIINSGAKIGKSNIINTGASVDHDCVLEDFIHLSPGARLAGNVRIEERSWIGIGSCICENLNIGKDVIVGAGAAVISDVSNNKTVLGVPAK